MGKGTLVSDGEGDEKIWVTQEVIYQGRVMAAADTSTTPYTTVGSDPVVKGAIYDLRWDPTNSCVNFDRDAKLVRATGTTNNVGGKSTEVTISDAGDSDFTVGAVVSIGTSTDDGGVANNNFPAQTVTTAPVSNGAGWLS